MLGYLPAIKQKQAALDSAFLHLFVSHLPKLGLERLDRMLYKAKASDKSLWLTALQQAKKELGIEYFYLATDSQLRQLSKHAKVRNAVMSLFPMFNVALILSKLPALLERSSTNPLLKALVKELAALRVGKIEKLSAGSNAVLKALTMTAIAKYSRFEFIFRYTESAISDYDIPARSTLLISLLDKDFVKDYRSEAQFESLLDGPVVHVFKDRGKSTEAIDKQLSETSLILQLESSGDEISKATLICLVEGKKHAFEIYGTYIVAHSAYFNALADGQILPLGTLPATLASRLPESFSDLSHYTLSEKAQDHKEGGLSPFGVVPSSWTLEKALSNSAHSVQ